MRSSAACVSPASVYDPLSARVAVTGQTVSLHISNTTRGTVFTKKLRMASPDVSSAEWIAEAPSACNGYGGCRPLPLTNFGTVTFAGATATAGGHTGTISDPAWPETAIALQADGGGFYHGRFAGLAAAADATPAALSSDGASFAISWQQATGGPDPQQQPDPFSE